MPLTTYYMQRKSDSPLQPDRYCFFCVNGIEDIDHKNTQLLQRFISSYFKIVPRRRSSVCSSHQRRLSQALKRARHLALLPYSPK